MYSSATISNCGRFRYTLQRAWDQTLPTLMFIMLNPSTADAHEDDPTIRKCIGFAERNGFGSIIACNLFAYRATDPKDLARAGFPVGSENDSHMEVELRALSRYGDGSKIVFAWGAHARKHSTRVAQVDHLVRSCGHEPHALKLLADGIPSHPLMLPYSSILEAIRHD